jgi:hypothetical protein
MYVFQIGFKDGNGNIYYSSGIYKRCLMDMFSWDVMSTARVNESKIRWAGIPSGKLELVGVTRNLAIETAAITYGVGWYDLDELENVEMMEIVDMDCCKEESAVYHMGGTKYNVRVVLDQIRGCGNMPKEGMPLDTWLKQERSLAFPPHNP